MNKNDKYIAVGLILLIAGAFSIFYIVGLSQTKVVTVNDMSNIEIEINPLQKGIFTKWYEINPNQSIHVSFKVSNTGQTDITINKIDFELWLPPTSQNPQATQIGSYTLTESRTISPGGSYTYTDVDTTLQAPDTGLYDLYVRVFFTVPGDTTNWFEENYVELSAVKAIPSVTVTITNAWSVASMAILLSGIVLFGRGLAGRFGLVGGV